MQSIAWCFGGSDTDKKNYITATPYMKNYMNAYVVKIARYLEKTSNHVMYRTTPVFVGEELMCRGGSYGGLFCGGQWRRNML